jgi:hypothetical protein
VRAYHLGANVEMLQLHWMGKNKVVILAFR